MGRAGSRGRFLCALVAILAAFASTDGNADLATDIVMLSEQEGVAAPMGPAYAEIPGFKFNYNSHPAKAESKEQCQQICSSQPTCKSFSYAKKLKECEWSTEKMQYDPDFVFNFKPAGGGIGQSYHEFPGLVYRATGWLKSEGKTSPECAELCDKAAACAAFSYRARDKLCLLSGHTIGFNEHFNYYEKEGTHKEFAMRPQAAATPAATPAPAPGTSAAAASAAAAAAAAATRVIQAAPVPPPVVQGEPESVVAERLQAVKDWAAQKIKQADEETKLKIRSNEVDNKAALEREKSDAEAAANDEKINEQKQEAKHDADVQAKAAQDNAAAMVAKVRLEAKEASVAAELTQAAAEKRQATVSTEKANKKIEDVKEIDEKNDVIRKKELAEKSAEKTNEDMQLRLVREKDTKANKVAIKSAVAGEVANVKSEMSAKSKTALEETAERQEKMVDAERARKSTRAVEVGEKKRALDSAVDKRNELETALAAANKATADAVVHESTTKAQMKVKIDEAESGATAKIAANELEAKGTSQQAMFAQTLATQKSDEQLRKKSTVEIDMEAASKEAVSKSNDDGCPAELKALQDQAETDEQNVAAQVSNMPDTEANKIMEDKKAVWAAKILAKQQECIPKAVDFTVDVKPLASAAVSAGGGVGPTLEEFLASRVTLLQEDEPTPPTPANELPPVPVSDPWPMDHKVTVPTADGSPGMAMPYADSETRLRESNAAEERGYHPIESGANEQVAYYKFKVAELRSGEIVKNCILKLRKQSGPASPCTVSLTSCDYEPDKLTYSNRPQIVNMVSVGGVFPTADGLVEIPLDNSLITSYLADEPAADSTVCVEVSGGQADTPVFINEVNLQMHIRKEPGVTDTTDRRRRTMAEVTVARRRRTGIEDSRRRRSVQVVKDEAESFYDQAVTRNTPIFEEEMDTKAPAAMAAKKRQIEQDVRQQYKSVIDDAIQAKLDSEFNKDAELAREVELNKQKVKEALDESFPAHYETEKMKLEHKMKDELRQQMTKEEEKIIAAEATNMADETVKTDADVLLNGAIQKKIAEDMPKALTAEVEKNAPKDYTEAIDEAVVASVQTKTEEAVDKAVQDEIDRRLKLQEDGVGTAAATDAVTTKMEELATQKIADEVQKEKLQNSNLGQKLNGNYQQKQDAMGVIETRVAQMPSLLSSSEQVSISKSAADAAVAKLKNQLTTEVNNQVRTPAFVDNVIRELKKSETTRLTPIVKSGILNNLQAELEPVVRPVVEEKIKKEVNAQRDVVLKTLHAGLVQKYKGDLLPKMNTKLAMTVPTALESAKFAAEVQAAQLEMKEKLREEMSEAIRTPMERVSKLKVKADEDERKEMIEVEVRQEKQGELDNMITAQTADDKIQPQVEQMLKVKMERDMEAKCKVETKRDVKLHLAPTLKEVLYKKYEEGTLAEAMAFVKSTKEANVRADLKSKLEKSVNDLVDSKMTNAKANLKLEVVDRLSKELFNQAKADGQEAFSQQVQGMTPANKASVELSHDQQLQTQANSDAQAQADVEMQSGLIQQLRQKLYTEEYAAASKNLEKDVEKKLQEEAKTISDKALKQKLDDDVEAMEVGKSHASQLQHDDHEVSVPDVVNAANLGRQMAGAASAVLANNNRMSQTDGSSTPPVNATTTNATTPTPSPTPLSPSELLDAAKNMTNSSIITDDTMNTTVNSTVVNAIPDLDEVKQLYEEQDLFEDV